MKGTEIAYVCGANYWRYLFMSLRTLLATGTSFDRVVIYVVGEEAPKWDLRDDRIHIKMVPDIGNGYWYLNKTHICQSDAERLIFLDTDTMVLSPIDEIYADTDADLIARPSPGVYLDNWKEENWQRFVRSAGAEDYPDFTCGFMIFQNGAHRKIADTWPQTTHRILRGELDHAATRFAEQQAMSISSSLEGLSYHVMEQRHHSYAMLGETDEDAVVYHLGTPNFYHYYLPVERKMGLRNLSLPVPRPSFPEVHKILGRLRHKMNTLRYGRRDVAVEHAF